VGRNGGSGSPKSLSRAPRQQVTAAGDWDPYEESWEEHQANQEPHVPIPSETEEYWNPPHLYHGTSEGLRPGDTVEPGHAPNYGGGESMDPRHTHSYATPHIRAAWDYAENAAVKRGGRPRVYEVGRAHDMMPDPESGHAVGGPQMIPEPGWRSRTGFPVLRELEHHELAGHTGAIQVTADDDEDWDTCYHCQEDHNPHDHEDDSEFNPDWDHILSRTPSVHRSLGVALPERDHALVHDPATPPEVAARTLLRHVTRAGGHTHWSTPQGMKYTQDSYGSVATRGKSGRPITSVTLHAHTPDSDDVESDPSELIEQEISPHRHPEYEIPVVSGASMHLTGLSWAHGQQGGWGDDNRWHDGPAQQWHHHEFPEPMRLEAAARWAPDSGIFAPTTGLDQRLFDDRGRLRPAVRGDIMERLDQCLRTDSGLTGSDWQGWLRVYLAGGSASEWAGSRPHEVAQDLDILIGVDYAGARSNTPEFRTMTDPQIDAALNAGLRGCFNADGWSPEGFEGTWDVTAYVNPQAWDIRSLRPYAAWDVSDSRWAVRPPHLPDHTLGDFNPAVLAEARAIATEARAILRLPEPLRTREAIALWERLHADRRAAFSGLGEGWTDPGNVAEKWLAYAPGNLLGRIRDLALAKTASAEPELPEGITMTPASEHRGYTSLDYPGQYPSRVRRRLQAERPAYYSRLRDHIAEHGVELPVLVTRNQHGATHIHNGTHRWAIANELGLPVPVGDYDSPEHRAYQENHPLTKEWEAQRTNTYGRTEPRTAAYVPEDEPAVRSTADLGWSPDEWAEARRDPWHASTKLAQQEVRSSHPKLTMDFPHGEEGDEMVGHLLRHAGYEGPTEGSFAARHPRPEQMTSNPSWLNGKPGVALHPEKWDYGTAAHECAHHVLMYRHAIAPNTQQTDEQVHGPEWAHAYGQVLNRISKHAGDDFVHHHQRFRGMITEGLRSVRPSDLDDAEQRLAPSRWEAPTERTGALEVRADAATPVGSPYTYEHDAYDGGTHWFSAQHPDAGEVGHAQVEEKEGPGGPHVEIKRLETDADHRGHGIGTQLLSNVEKYFPGRELRLKPYPLDEDGDQSTEDLEEYYGGRGFEHRPLREGEPTELYDYMHKQAAVTGYTGLTGHSGMIYLELPEDAVHHLKGGVDDHHITVVYLGKNISDEAFEEACRRAEQAARQSRPMSGFLRGVETFEQGDGSRGKTPVFVPAYVPGIGHLRSLLEDLNGSQHRQYRPHVTLAYLGEDDDLPKAHPKVDVRFDRLHVKRGDDVVSFPLGPSQ
jgi:GNAT superfamily N-acetyltransferase